MLRRVSVATASSSVVLGRRRRPRPRGSRWPRRPVGRGRSARAAPRPPRPAHRRTAGAPGARCGARVPRGPASDRSRSPARRSRGARGAGRRRGARRSRGRGATRRGLAVSVWAARVGAVASSRVDERREAVGGELGLEASADRRVVGQRVEVDAARDGSQVQARAADQQRDAVARGHLGQHLPGMRRRNRPAAKRSGGSTRSRPACGTRARSAALTLAVPMSRPR